MSDIRQLFHGLSGAEFISLRAVTERAEQLEVRRDVPEPPRRTLDRGAMLTVVERGGSGYAGTADLSQAGLKRARADAMRMADATRDRLALDPTRLRGVATRVRYSGPGVDLRARPTLAERFDLLAEESRRCRIDERIVDWAANLWTTHSEQLFLSSDGADVEQSFEFVVANVSVTANDGPVTQTRTLGGQYNGFSRQGGSEVLDAAGFHGAGRRVAADALELLAAPECPSGTMDLLLMPDQMMLQIHESIGHPLELDRILGDERNFAGGSFVTPDMFGSYQYGSALLNVNYDPSRREQFASYACDDDGTPAERQWIIRAGILERPLGGSLSQARAGLPGVANSRACSWNRPPIDRMANLNVEAGDARLGDMIAAVERGVLMRTNASWSIDDSRNKFQFGCEWGQLIENGRLGRVVRNPNYRGISATFWRSLAAVGDASTLEVLGSPWCGKGEPSQIVRVGHASPACLFRCVDVLGGEPGQA